MAANGGLDLILRERRNGQPERERERLNTSDVTHSDLGLPYPLGVLCEVLLDVSCRLAVDLLGVEGVT